MSGGERKRTSIGYEIIADSKVMILDEPTSGLDSANTFMIMKYLKKIAKVKNITVICSLHSPSSDVVNLCDQISCLSNGSQVYLGPPDDSLRTYFSEMGVQMPKYCNPADFLLKIANEPEKYGTDFAHLTSEKQQNKIREYARNGRGKNDKEYIEHVIANDVEIVKYNLQFKEIFMRTSMMALRAPTAIIGLIGISSFASFLTNSIFAGVGKSEIDFMDITKTQISIKNIMGLSSYLNNDIFAACLFSNILTLDSFLPVAKREIASGTYSVHMLYFGLWVSKILTIGFYPIIIYLGIFQWLGLVDSSNENLMYLLRVGIIQMLNGLTLGHMWGTIFEETQSSILSGFCLMQFVTAGSGHMLSTNSNIFIKALSTISPSKYTLELILHRVLNKHVAKGFILGYLKINYDEFNARDFY